MKKIIAILLALSLMVALVGCNNKEDPDPTETTAEATENSAVNSNDVEESTTEELTDTEESTTDDNGNEPVSEKTTDKTEENDEIESTTANEVLSDDPAEWSKEQIVTFYKQPAVKSHPTARSSQTMKLNKLVINDGDGALNFFLNMVRPVIDTALKNNSNEYNGLTGGFTKLEASDVKSAKAYKQGNYTVVEMVMVEQTDGLYGDAQEGTVGHAINVLGNVSDAVAQFPDFDIKFEEADIKVHYANPTVKVKVNNKGIIEKGTWRYDSIIAIKHLDISGIMIDKADAEIEYTIVVGGGF